MLEGYAEFLELRRELFNYFRNGGMTEHHKSYEGTFEISMSYPNYFDSDCMNDSPSYISLDLFCYVIGPNRHYTWSGKTLREAVNKAKKDIYKFIGESKNEP